MGNKKELDRDILKRFFSSLHALGNDEEELQEIIENQQKKFSSLLAHSPPWSYLYEMPYTHLLAIFVCSIGMGEAVVECSKDSQSITNLFDEFERAAADIDNDSENESITDEELSALLTMLMAVLGNIWCLKIYSIPLNTLIEQIRDGDDEALFDAVLVDRVALSAPTIARRIQMAHILNDESFFTSLSKAIKRTRPRRPLKELDDMRYMVEAIDEVHGLSEIPHEDLFDFLANDLEIYHSTEEKRDPASSLKQLITRRKYHQ